MKGSDHIRAALEALGFPDDPEMTHTHEQVATFLNEFTSKDPLPAPQVLPTNSDDLLVVRDLPYHSLCAHHLLPFFGQCTIVLRPKGKVVGLGWFPRLLAHLARRPQLQERLANQLAEEMMRILEPTAVVVRLTARQMCVEMRGARSPGTVEVIAERGSVNDLHGFLNS